MHTVTFITNIYLNCMYYFNFYVLQHFFLGSRGVSKKMAEYFMIMVSRISENN